LGVVLVLDIGHGADGDRYWQPYDGSDNPDYTSRVRELSREGQVHADTRALVDCVDIDRLSKAELREKLLTVQTVWRSEVDSELP
jgi:hypothetical protein